MNEILKPVIAFREDIDTWIYFDQSFRVFRYEIYCIGYNPSGSPGTLEFVIEEGILPEASFPEVSAYQRPAEQILPGLLQWKEYMGFLPQHNVNYHPLCSSKLHKMERRLKRTSRSRIMEKLRRLGYEVIAAV